MATVLAIPIEEALTSAQKYRHKDTDRAKLLHRRKQERAIIREIVAAGLAAKIDLATEPKVATYLVTMQTALRPLSIAIRKRRNQPLAYAFRTQTHI